MIFIILAVAVTTTLILYWRRTWKRVEEIRQEIKEIDQEW